MTKHTNSIIRTASGMFAGLTIVAVGFIATASDARASDYNVWRSNFGRTAATVSDDGRAAPAGHLADWQANDGTSSSTSTQGADYVVWRKTLG